MYRQERHESKGSERKFVVRLQKSNQEGKR